VFVATEIVVVIIIIIKTAIVPQCIIN